MCIQGARNVIGMHRVHFFAAIYLDRATIVSGLGLDSQVRDYRYTREKVCDSLSSQKGDDLGVRTNCANYWQSDFEDLEMKPASGICARNANPEKASAPAANRTNCDARRLLKARCHAQFRQCYCSTIRSAWRPMALSIPPKMTR